MKVATEHNKIVDLVYDYYTEHRVAPKTLDTADSVS